MKVVYNFAVKYKALYPGVMAVKALASIAVWVSRSTEAIGAEIMIKSSTPIVLVFFPSGYMKLE